MAPDPKTVARTHSVSFLVKAAFLSALAAALGLGALRWILDRPLGPEYGEAHHAIRSLLPLVGPAVVFCGVSVLLVGAVSLLILGVLASHKVAGPLFRLQRVAGFVERGILPGPIHLRATDQGTALAEALNVFVDRWKAVLRAETDRMERVEEAWDRWSHARDPKDREKALEELRRLAG
ncbi:MAG: hypothetical protein D6708_12485 [Candidatus Dadabacteria bacterium]|nr:MAG: hypothetical protein D6708_12485 [Candidatus Dadabacteria bacterium]